MVIEILATATKTIKSNAFKPAVEPAADFEKAIEATGFGRFNIILLVLSIPATMATTFESSVISYILPSAECDLSLSLFDKGLLNAITYCGMILSAILWGYIADTRGRKMLLVYAYLADVFCVIGAAISQNVWQLMLFKFIGGFIMCGPYPVLMSYLSEFHGSFYRSRIMMLAGVTFPIASIALPIMAMIILPVNWDFRIFDMKFTDWKVFLAISAIPSLVSGVLFLFFPESPKFLMSQGRNEEAMEAFKMIYAINTGHNRDEYPVKQLINELTEKEINIKFADNMKIPEKLDQNIEDPTKQHKNSTNTFRELFSKSYLKFSILFYLMYVCIHLGQNTTRLWLPQLFASTNEYQQVATGPATMCTILEYSVNKTDLVTNDEEACVVIVTPSTYANNIIVALSDLIFGIIASYIIKSVGNKRMQIVTLFLSGCFGIIWYWSYSSLSTLIISTLYACMSGIASTASIGASVNLFPTSLRTMVVSIALMCGRIGTISGNMLFPIFITLGCIPPFLMFGGIMFLGSILAMFLPDTDNLDFK